MTAHPGVLEAGTVLADRFRIIRLLGAGGMGAVYEIEHELTKHRRAMKLLHPEFAQHEQVVTRFVREASAAGRIGNPHIIETFDAGKLDSGEPYLVMELLDGQPLNELMAAHPEGLPFAEVAELVTQACRGIQAAHDADIVHRDLKPENLFVANQDGKPFVKVLDFGVSKFAPGVDAMRATTEGSIIGTPLYMSPEQLADDEELDGRSDVYALALIAYEALAGKHPYPADSMGKLALKILQHVPPPITELRPDVPKGAAHVLEKALSKKREDRIASPAALAEALTALVKDPDLDLLGATMETPGPMTEPSALDATIGASSMGATVEAGSPGDVKPKRPVKISVRPVSGQSAPPGSVGETEVLPPSNVTPPASTAPLRAESPPSRKPLWVVGAVVVLGGAWFVAAGGLGGTSESAAPTTGAEAVDGEHETVADPSARTSVTPIASTSVASASPPPPSSASATPSATSAPSAAAKPPAPAAPPRPPRSPPPPPPPTGPDIADKGDFGK